MGRRAWEGLVVRWLVQAAVFPKINKTQTVERCITALSHWRLKTIYTPKLCTCLHLCKCRPPFPALCTSANKSDRQENLMNCLIYEKPSAHQWFMGLITESIHEPGSPVVLPFAAGWQKYCSQTNPLAPSHQKAINPEKLPRVSCILALNV